LRDDIAMIRRNVELEARLIDDLLDLTRISRGKLELHRQPQDIRQIVEHAVEIACAPRVAAGKLNLQIDFTADRRHVQADSGRLTQLLWNLLSNAVKFTPDGGRIGIAMRNLTDAAGDWLVIEVTDSGMGIEPETLPKIFDAFEQGPVSITRDYGGLGLGLAIGKAIVDLHGGRISAFSEGLHLGSTFSVHLPLCDAPAKELSRSAPFHGDASTAATRDHPLHILLVEDHEDSAKIMALVIRRMGHKVSTADSVSAALSVAARAQDINGDIRPIDLVVSDIGLPDGSGLDLMRQLAVQYKLKGIALTGHGLDDDQARSRDAGFIEHLTKPVNLQRLEAVIRECTQRR
jgi:CheY-like chemotaxis protein